MPTPEATQLAAAQRGAESDPMVAILADRDAGDRIEAGAPQTSGGDAGERARAAVEALPSRLFDRKHTEEIALCLVPEFEAALRSSHREGAEAMREAIVRWHEYHAGISAPGTVRDWHKASSIHHSDMPIPGMTDAP